jgi:hypothetical protein
LARCNGANPVCVSSVSLFFLYYFSILSLVLAFSMASNGASAWALPANIPRDCSLASRDGQSIGSQALTLDSDWQIGLVRSHITIREQEVPAPHANAVASELMQLGRPADRRISGERKQGRPYRFPRDFEVAVPDMDGIGQGRRGIHADEVAEIPVGKRAISGKKVLGRQA